MRYRSNRRADEAMEIIACPAAESGTSRPPICGILRFSVIDIGRASYRIPRFLFFIHSLVFLIHPSTNTLSLLLLTLHRRLVFDLATRFNTLPHTLSLSFAARYHARSCRDELRSSTQVSAGDPAGEHEPLPRFCLVGLGLAVASLYSAILCLGLVPVSSRSSPSS
jgi:hypothetical protein